MTTTTGPLTTGPKSTSFQVFLAGAIPGLLTLAHGLLAGGQPASAKLASILGGSGLTAISAAVKLLHDSGIHQATIAAAGSEVQGALPQLKADAEKAAAFVDQDFPAVSAKLVELESRLKAEENKVVTAVPDAGAIEAVVRQVLGGVVAPPAPATTVILS